jgi:hypothetical protein
LRKSNFSAGMAGSSILDDERVTDFDQPRQTQRRAALADSPSIVRPWPGCAKRYPARAHEPVTDLSHLAGASAEARIQFMNAGDRGDRQ